MRPLYRQPGCDHPAPEAGQDPEAPRRLPRDDKIRISYEELLGWFSYCMNSLSYIIYMRNLLGWLRLGWLEIP